MDTVRFSVLDLLNLDLREHNALNLRCIGGRKGLGRQISVPDLNRPGLALSGFFDAFAFQRIQVFGRGEYAYLEKLEREGSLGVAKRVFEFEMPCCIFTHSLAPQAEFLASAEAANCPILQTDLSSSEFVGRILRVLSDIFAPKTSIHGVLVEVFGIGILLSGDSGVGKSETALELIERGHRLVADDVVEIRCVNGNYLMGQGANKIVGHHMEIRGLGIINVTHLFGVGAIRDKKQIQLVCNLEEWDADKVYDRIGTDEKTVDILGVMVPQLDIPVKPGRNIPIIIETAAMNERLKKMGYHSAKEFNRNILRWLESENARAVYFGQDDIL
ncbi:MAG TPA: HPr(Ser) kinase/phosphatase [Spirochaetia bacterium]|nr:HPr(Ser) kinase/phosphatase [Spirochaetales bacterium]HRY80636.1 HPr(Ser) kinase/phosphatase [Spirochaetia bacterium]